MRKLFRHLVADSGGEERWVKDWWGRWGAAVETMAAAAVLAAAAALCAREGILYSEDGTRIALEKVDALELDF